MGGQTQTQEIRIEAAPQSRPVSMLIDQVSQHPDRVGVAPGGRVNGEHLLLEWQGVARLQQAVGGQFQGVIVA